MSGVGPDTGNGGNNGNGGGACTCDQYFYCEAGCECDQECPCECDQTYACDLDSDGLELNLNYFVVYYRLKMSLNVFVLFFNQMVLEKGFSRVHYV